MIYEIPLTFVSCATHKVEADSLQEAIDKTGKLDSKVLKALVPDTFIPEIEIELELLEDAYPDEY